jgi:hypothetical protein
LTQLTKFKQQEKLLIEFYLFSKKTDEQLEALMPTLSSAPLKNSQVILTGTSPRNLENGEVFTRLRETAIEEKRVNKNPKICWHE